MSLKSILFVDDEAQIIKVLLRLFADKGYDVHSARCATEALAQCREGRIDLVVSDMWMPEMGGMELLSAIKRDFPETMRIILSGYSDEKKMLEALQNNIAMVYLFKPWNNDELFTMIQRVFQTKELLSSRELLSAINRIDQLPTLEPFMQDILQAIQNDEDITAISGRIERDHSIASSVLHIINSAYYGVKTGSVKKAVSFLGLVNVKELILSTSIMKTLEVKGNGAHFAQDIWNHSYMTNRIYQAIAGQFIEGNPAALASSAGLLHNIGIVFMLQQDSIRYLKLVKETLRNPGAILSELELVEYGFTHAQAGGFLLQWWNLPYPVVEAALYHDNPTDDRIINKRVVAAIHMAQQIASTRMGIKPDCRFHPEVLNGTGITMDGLSGESFMKG